MSSSDHITMCFCSSFNQGHSRSVSG